MKNHRRPKHTTNYSSDNSASDDGEVHAQKKYLNFLLSPEQDDLRLESRDLSEVEDSQYPSLPVVRRFLCFPILTLFATLCRS